MIAVNKKEIQSVFGGINCVCELQEFTMNPFGGNRKTRHVCADKNACHVTCCENPKHHSFRYKWADDGWENC